MIESNKTPLCITCAFKYNLENNKNAIVMSKDSLKLITRCTKCNVRIGHSNNLNSLIGIYHQRRHEKHEEPKITAGLGERFKIYKKNKYNGGNLNCFVMAIKNRGYSERTIREYLNDTLEDEDYEPLDKKKAIEELIEISKKPGMTGDL